MQPPLRLTRDNISRGSILRAYRAWRATPRSVSSRTRSSIGPGSYSGGWPGATTTVHAGGPRSRHLLERRSSTRPAISSVTDDMAAACDFSNRYAPEHLIVNVENAESWLSQLDNAGSIFLGRWTPESVGDYASGTNHVLPTYGYSRMYSGVSLDSFVKYMTVQELTKEGLDALGPHVARMAAVEGLDAHRSAVTLRLGID